MNVRRLAGRAPRWLWPIVAGVAIAVAALTVVGAETGKDERAEKTDRGSDRCERIVELVGAEDCESLLAALKEGQTLAQIAEANEIAAQTVIDGLVDDAETRITDRVNNGGAEFGRGWHRGGITRLAVGLAVGPSQRGMAEIVRLWWTSLAWPTATRSRPR